MGASLILANFACFTSKNSHINISITGIGKFEKKIDKNWQNKNSDFKLGQFVNLATHG